MIRGAIFDLDGTLLDTLTSIAGAFNRSLTTLGLPTHPIDAYRHFIGDGVFKCAERCLPERHRTARNIDTLVGIQRQDYGENWRYDTAPYPGITELLNTLTADGVRLATLSNKDHPFAVQCIDHFFPGDTFSEVVGYSETVPHKPDPTGTQLILDRWHLPADDCVFVGDTSVDIATAKACNTLSVGVLWGFRDRQELQQAGADYIISSPQELNQIIGKHK